MEPPRATAAKERKASVVASIQRIVACTQQSANGKRSYNVTEAAMTQFDLNIQTVQQIYAAFGKGDLPALTERLSSDAEFSFEGGSAQVPWHGPWRGSEQIGRVFAALSEHVAFEAFEPLAFAAGVDIVAVRLHLRYRVVRTGRRVDEHQVHWWTLRDGKVHTLTHFEDTAQVLAANPP
jgi:ketosteroid isomerase-like protein